ncbi:hypothetical protein GUJ93_ZPchr0006g42832 [Zizania palustris]|uniref:Uncharacterized protein n=1 Tax=Zizania palustris TaxID=103762 RepID=A0A8J5T7M1_ZIZPA|nr:hypothetical protein GUJ93_ZPchr0006g42832 [Zizania palustris]
MDFVRFSFRTDSMESVRFSFTADRIVSVFFSIFRCGLLIWSYHCVSFLEMHRIISHSSFDILIGLKQCLGFILFLLLWNSGIRSIFLYNRQYGIRSIFL